MARPYYRLFLVAILLWSCVATYAASDDNDSPYTEEQPLVYEDAWDLWPYAFLNDTGEPVGYNIDLLRLIFRELAVPT